MNQKSTTERTVLVGRRKEREEEEKPTPRSRRRTRVHYGGHGVAWQPSQPTQEGAIKTIPYAHGEGARTVGVWSGRCDELHCYFTLLVATSIELSDWSTCSLLCYSVIAVVTLHLIHQPVTMPHS